MTKTNKYKITFLSGNCECVWADWITVSVGGTITFYRQKEDPQGTVVFMAVTKYTKCVELCPTM